MRQKILGIIITLMLALPMPSLAESTTISENLPLDVQVDLLMTELSRLLKIDDNEGVIALIPRIRSLDIEIPDSLFFLEARALYRTGDALAARDRLVVYLANTGREGRYYDQATELLLAVKEDAATQEIERQEADRKRREELAKSAEKARALRIREAQRHLQQVGFPDALETGELDKQTRIALATYQILNDLQVNGDISEETVARLTASVPETHACDDLAGYPAKPIEWGVRLSEIAANVAVPACNDALREYPDVIRFQIQYARALFAAERPNDAMTAVEKAARLGYPAAETLIGRMHLQGALSDNGRPDETNALRWFQFAAEDGYPEAQIEIGRLHDNGDADLRRSSTMAVEWYLKAAEQGFPPAQVIIGQRHTDGQGISRDSTAAFQWYTRAADVGYPSAEFLVGYSYERGRGVKRNKASAIAWYKRASEQGHSQAAERLKRLDR